jgi:S-formylglutathione hydrolase FrmB
MRDTCLLSLQFPSAILGMEARASVLLPARSPVRAVLYLLHGYSDDETGWWRRTSLERHADGLGIAVVMPCGALSFYADMAGGPAYNRHVGTELPAFLASRLRLPGGTASTFIAGNSMGGYGAFRIAMEQPGRFAGACAISGVMDIASPSLAEAGPLRRQMKLVFGAARLRNSRHDLGRLVRGLAGLRRPPALRAVCGTGDFLIGDNRRFRDLAARYAVALDYSESEGGHDWDFWDGQVQPLLAWVSARARSTGRRKLD